MTHDHLHPAGEQGCAVCRAAMRPEPVDAMSRRRVLATLTAGLAATGTAFAAPAPGPVQRQGRRITILEPSWVLAYRDGAPVLLADHSVVVDGDRVARIVEGRIKGNDQRIAMPGQILLPGLISGHTHVACGSPTRGLVESGRAYGRPLDLIEALDDADIDALTAYNLAEILRAGCTTQVEQSVTLRQVQSYVRVARRWGARGYPGGMTPTWSRVAPVWFRKNDQVLLDSTPATLADIEANLRFGLEVNGAEDGLILPMMAPHGPETQTPETWRAIVAGARKLHGIHTHLASIESDSVRIKKLWGKGPVQWLDEFGAYDVRFFGAHMSGWDAAEDGPFLAGKPLFTYVHCPSGTGAGGGGVRQPFIEAMGAGINSAVGLDTHSNDMVENMKLALLYGRARHAALSASSSVPMKRPTVWDMINAATLNPANGLGRSDLGRIAVGAKADLVSIDVSGLLVGSGVAPLEPLGNLLYANGLSVRHVMTNGRLQISDGRLVVDDERKVVAEGGRVVRKIWRQLIDEGWLKA